MRVDGYFVLMISGAPQKDLIAPSLAGKNKTFVEGSY